MQALCWLSPDLGPIPYQECSALVPPRGPSPTRAKPSFTMRVHVFSYLETSNKALGKRALYYSELLLLSLTSWYIESKYTQKGSHVLVYSCSLYSFSKFSKQHLCRTLQSVPLLPNLQHESLTTSCLK